MNNSESHIVAAYDRELNELRMDLERMGELAIAQLGGAMHAIDQLDFDIAQKIVEQDILLDNLEHEIDGKVMQVLAKRQPMANDLRLIIAILKASALMERIGDFSKNIAKRVPMIKQVDGGQIMKNLFNMSLQIRTMLADVMEGFQANDVDKILMVWEADANVDALFTVINRTLITYMMEDPRNITPCAHLMFIAKNLERIGDHATNLAEISYYYIEGVPLLQKRPKGGDLLAELMPLDKNA